MSHRNHREHTLVFVQHLDTLSSEWWREGHNPSNEGEVDGVVCRDWGSPSKWITLVAWIGANLHIFELHDVCYIRDEFQQENPLVIQLFHVQTCGDARVLSRSVSGQDCQST
jgi:hypothetical protein